MNKYGKLSLLMVGICIFLSFFLGDGRDPQLFRMFWLSFNVISLLGIVFAILSKKWFSMFVGLLLNCLALVLFNLLLMGLSIGEY